MGNKVKEQITTPVGVFRWVYLEKPDTSKQGKNKYKVTVALPKGVPANDALAKKLNDLHRSVGGKRDKLPVKDGDLILEDIEDADKKAKAEWMRGLWLITGKSKDRIKVKAPNGKTNITEMPRTGDEGRVLLYATDYDVDGSKGVSCYLNGAQLLVRNNQGNEANFDDLSDQYGEVEDRHDTGAFSDESGSDGARDQRPEPEPDDGDY